ncbi:hypothetical protein GCM10017688_09600 [Streptomyces ramulosus]
MSTFSMTSGRRGPAAPARGTAPWADDARGRIRMRTRTGAVPGYAVPVPHPVAGAGAGAVGLCGAGGWSA